MGQNIALDRLSKSFGSRVLFEEVTVAFNAGNRYGLTGPNGAGKSTLLKILMGFEEASSGQVSLPDRIGFLRQNIEDYAAINPVDVVIMGNQRLWDALRERDRLYELEIDDQIGMQLGDLEAIIGEENGYAAESEAETLLAGIGLTPEQLTRPLGELPSDLQFRVLLCQALFGEPQALLLDEPTNHLDLGSIGWLEEFLHSYKGVLVVVSHDRHFLNSVTTHIADVDYETVIIYPGNYDAMVMAKSAVREQAERDTKSREKKISQLKEFVARFGAGTRASQVQSRMREMSKLEPQELKKSNIQRPYIRLIASEKNSGKVILKAENLSGGYGDLKVIENFNYEVMRGDKIAIIGNNGRGKTTLLKLLAGQLTATRGLLEYGHQVMTSYFPQLHHELIDKNGQESAFEWLRSRRHGLYDQDIRSALGKMLFSGDDAFKPISALSGGETGRLLLAAMMLQEHNFLLLDEPNNHLDLEAVSALGCGLDQYKGTVIAVSHDRDLIDAFANRIIAFEKEGICLFNGPLEEYLAQRTPQ